MLDRTNFASWQQRIQLYCQGKENGVNILKLIDEGPFQIGTIRDTLAEGIEGAHQLGLERARVYSDLSPEDKDWVIVQNVQGQQNRGQRNNARGAGAAGYEGAQNRVGNSNPSQARQIKCYNCSGRQDTTVDEDVDEQPVQDLTLNVDNVFQADDYDAFDSDVDEAPTVQTMFMENLSSADPVYDEASPSYDSNILSENKVVPVIVHNTEDTLEIAEITKRKMNDKIKDPECVTNKVKIAPP
ncbi:hypothetical protein Tco_0720205, partial [Tanacetum coccineum]